mmetsp:Transcript_34732/g.87664  ORF Transcript_34732/g.87664 Transcript_34732/m.87664 type:complete len:281 (+) Transcript_34732:1035-1877(+)
MPLRYTLNIVRGAFSPAKRCLPAEPRAKVPTKKPSGPLRTSHARPSSIAALRLSRCMLSRWNLFGDMGSITKFWFGSAHAPPADQPLSAGATLGSDTGELAGAAVALSPLDGCVAPAFGQPPVGDPSRVSCAVGLGHPRCPPTPAAATARLAAKLSRSPSARPRTMGAPTKPPPIRIGAWVGKEYGTLMAGKSRGKDKSVCTPMSAVGGGFLPTCTIFSTGTSTSTSTSTSLITSTSLVTSTSLMTSTIFSTTTGFSISRSTIRSTSFSTTFSLTELAQM